MYSTTRQGRAGCPKAHPPSHPQLLSPPPTQVLSPKLQRRQDESRRHRYLRYNVVRSVAYYANRYGGILLPGGSLNLDAISRIFQVRGGVRGRVFFNPEPLF